MDTRGLRGNDLKLLIAIPFGEQLHQPAADLAMPVVHHRVAPGRIADARRYRLTRFGSRDGAPNGGNTHLAAAMSGALAGSTCISGGCVSVLCTPQRFATRTARGHMPGASDGHSSFTLIEPTRCGCSTKLQLTSMRRSSTLKFLLVAQLWRTEKVHMASELPSM